MAQSKRLAVSAENIANPRSRGLRQDGPAEQPGAYRPQRVQDVTTAGGGVRAAVRPVTPPAIEVYTPWRPDADAESVAAIPNVNLASDLVTQLQAPRADEDHAAALRTQTALLHRLPAHNYSHNRS